MKKDFSLILGKIVNDNDEKSFNILFDYFYPQLFKYSLFYVKQATYAEEVVSDVFYKMLKNKNKISKIKNISYYLFKSVKNQSLTFLRDNKKKAVFHFDQQEEDYIITELADPEILMRDKEIEQLYEGAVKKLPPQRQLIFQLIREQGMNYTEVGDLLNISPRTVETHLGLAIKDLYQMLKLYLQDQEHTLKVRKMIF